MNGWNPQWRLSITPALSLALPARVFIEVAEFGPAIPRGMTGMCSLNRRMRSGVGGVRL